MAITVTVQKTINFNNAKCVLATVTMDDSYVTGGEVLAPSDFGLDQVWQVFAGSPPQGGVIASWDGVGVSKLKLWQSSTGVPAIFTQVASTQDVSTAVIPVVVFGG